MSNSVFGKGYTDKVSLYIPSTANVSVALTESAAELYVSRSLRFLSRMFGGATAIPASGAWVSEDTLVTEKVTIVYSFTQSLTRQQLLEIQQHCLELKRDLAQESIAVEINGELFLI